MTTIKYYLHITRFDKDRRHQITKFVKKQSSPKWGLIGICPRWFYTNPRYMATNNWWMHTLSKSSYTWKLSWHILEVQMISSPYRGSYWTSENSPRGGNISFSYCLTPGIDTVSISKWHSSRKTLGPQYPAWYSGCLETYYSTPSRCFYRGNNYRLSSENSCLFEWCQNIREGGGTEWHGDTPCD